MIVYRRLAPAGLITGFAASLPARCSRLFWAWPASITTGRPSTRASAMRRLSRSPFSHAQHAGQLGLSCLYCHTGVEESSVAKIPPTQTCMNCHQAIKADSPQARGWSGRAWTSGKPIPWVRVHQTPDYVYFNHAVHVRRGVGCVSCHGKVNEMPVVVHDKPLSMGWCLDCHRDPENHLRPPAEVTNFAWQPPEGRSQRDFGLFLKDESRIHAPEQCAGCHR